jgi:hypothetical protein
MNSNRPYEAAVRAVVVTVALAAGLSACGDRISDTRAKAPQPAKADPSTVVIGQAPAAPTGDPPGTTPIASGTTEISTATENTKKPQEGDDSSHSTLAPKTPQKADGNNTAAQRSTP